MCSNFPHLGSNYWRVLFNSSSSHHCHRDSGREGSGCGAGRLSLVPFLCPFPMLSSLHMSFSPCSPHAPSCTACPLPLWKGTLLHAPTTCHVSHPSPILSCSNCLPTHIHKMGAFPAVLTGGSSWIK